MAKEYEFEMYGHPSMYGIKERKLNVYFSEPEQGVNTETGILLLIAGFGGNSNSNVYKKMRNVFADTYNLITIQCDYFGWEFMQGPNNISLNTDREQLNKLFKKEEINYIYQDDNIFNRLMEVHSANRINISAKEILDETLENYNDMGLIQAIDNVSAVINVIEIIKDNGYEFNRDKIILYGNSHGAYLSYLSNAIAPELFSLLIDNSSWLFPTYLKNNRNVFSTYGDTTLSVEFDYMAKSLVIDNEMLDLNSLYKKFNNNCDIISYHGTNDNLISHKDKKNLKQFVKHFKYVEIGVENIDNKIFKSNQHGLGADFLELFDFTIKDYKFGLNSKHDFEKQNDVIYRTENFQYTITYENIVPELTIKNMA